MASGDDEFLIKVAETLIGSAANLVLPGLGSVLLAAIRRATPDDPSKSLTAALVRAFQVVRPRESLTFRRRVREKLAKKERKESNKQLEGINLGTLMNIARSGTDPEKAGMLASLSEDEKSSWSSLGRAQLAMVGSPGFFPGVWEDEFAALIAGLAEPALSGSGQDRTRWRKVIGLAEGEAEPEPAEVRDWARSVARAFAAQIDGDPKLSLYARQLRRSDDLAMRHALLWQLDQQRQALQLIAVAVCALLIALGVEIDVLG